jgi:hypothetical protein
LLANGTRFARRTDQMFSSTVKRPAATLAVVAGLLAAAGPASATWSNGDGNDAQAAPQGIVTNGTADDQMSVIPWLWDNQAVAGPRAHGSDIKPWQATHQTSGSFMR